MFQQYCLWLVGIASLFVSCKSTVLRKYLLPFTREADFPETKAAHLGLKVISFKMKNLLTCWIYSVVEDPRRIWMPGRGSGYKTSKQHLASIPYRNSVSYLVAPVKGEAEFWSSRKTLGTKRRLMCWYCCIPIALPFRKARASQLFFQARPNPQ